MARTIVRKLYATTVTNGAASITIPQNARITAIAWDCTGIAPANVTACDTMELSLNTSTSQISTNDTITSLSSISLFSNIASAAASVRSFSAGMSIPVLSGDRLILNGGQTGSTAMASARFACHVYMEV